MTAGSAKWMAYLVTEPVNGLSPRPQALPLRALELLLCIPVLVFLLVLIPPLVITAFVVSGGIKFIQRVAKKYSVPAKNNNWWE